MKPEPAASKAPAPATIRWLRLPVDTTFALLAWMGALPLFFARHLPFADLPEHLAVIATLRHWWTPGWNSQEYFVVEGALRTQYLLYDLVGAALAFPLGTAERANFVIVVATALGFPYGLRALLRALGRDERLALFAVPLFWNRALAEGLLPFVSSIPVALYGLTLVVRQVAEPSTKRAIGLGALGVLLFYLHISGFLLLAVGAGAITLTWLIEHRERTVRAILSRAAWIAPSALICLAFALTSPVTRADTPSIHAKVIRFLPKGALVELLPVWMHDFWKSPGDEIAAALAWLGLIIAIVAGLKRPAIRSTSFVVGMLLFGSALAFYFFMPTQVGFAFILDLRMAPVVGLFAVLCAMPTGHAHARTLAVDLVAIAALLTGLHGAVQMQRMEQEEARHIDYVLHQMPEGKRLLSLVFDPSSRYTNIAPYLHMGGYYRARYGGIASFSFAELPHWPVRYRPEVAPPTKPVVFWDFAPCEYRNTVDGPHYDYVLTRGEEAPFAQDLPGPRFKLVGGARDLRLYKRLEGQDSPGIDRQGPCPHRAVPISLR